MNEYRWHPHHEKINVKEFQHKKLSEVCKLLDIEFNSRKAPSTFKPKEIQAMV